jgi:phosphoribosylformylglycinamidine synthase
MLWEVEIRPGVNREDREGSRIAAEAKAVGASSIRDVASGHAFLIEGDLQRTALERVAREFLVDGVVESFTLRPLSAGAEPHGNGHLLLNVLFKPGVTDNVGSSAASALRDRGFDVQNVATCRKYWINGDAEAADVDRLIGKVLANDAIERVVCGPLHMTSIAVGSPYRFELKTVPLREMSDEQLAELSRSGQLYLSLVEMQTIQKYFHEEGRDPVDVELETIAQTWSEHCSHKTLAGRIHYRDGERDIQFENMLKETIFAATMHIREQLGGDDWCVSVFKDNAGIVRFDDEQNVCFKVETHNHPSALEPYGGANTGIGGVIRDPLGTGLGARPVCNTDVFCFAPPDTPYESLPPGVLHPKLVAKGVVAGVRDYGNRMGIPTVNGAVFFDERYLGNPLVYCGNVAMIPADKCEKRMRPGDFIVAVGGRTGRDGIHGATFSSAELTHESETLSGGAVQIGNAVVEKMLADVILEARDRGLYSAITDCGAGGFSSAVGEMGEETGAEVWLEKAPLKYAGLSYTEIWISEAQERMVLAVPPDNWTEFRQFCESEGVEATIIGKFTQTKRLVLKYDDHLVADLSMEFLHDGRPPVIRDAVYQASRERQRPGFVDAAVAPVADAPGSPYDEALRAILSSLNVCSKEWIIRQYDHEVQSGSVVKPLVGASNDGPSDAAVVRPLLTSNRGLAISNGMNPRYGDLDPYWMAASAIDEAVRNCVAVGADPQRIAILDNFCWGNTEKPDVLGSLVRAALGCHDTAIAFGTPFISGKDSLNNEFSYVESGEPGVRSGRLQPVDGPAEAGHYEPPTARRTVSIPPSLLISALGQLDDVAQAVTMDLKQSGNLLYQIGETKDELGGSHYSEVGGRRSEIGNVPIVNLERAPRIFAAVHQAISKGLIRSCHDLSEGGLAVALAETSFAGGLGVDVSLGSLSEATKLADDVLLFSESNTRFVAEVEPEHQREFETCFAELPLFLLGTVADGDSVQIRDATGEPLINSRWADLKAAWQQPLAWD